MLLRTLVVVPAAVLLAATSASAQFACTLSAQDQDTCDASTAEDGTSCVWCSVASYGFCVTEAQAKKMEQNIPGIDCDDFNEDDDFPDDDVYDDDDAPAEDDDAPAEDDDAAPADDDHADYDDDNYWTCLEANDSKACGTKGGCVWCDTTAGYGICMDEEAAADANDSEFYDCHLSSAAIRSDPYDTTCLMASLQQDEDACVSTVDDTGTACEWCSLAGFDMCLTIDQADMALQFGAECGADAFEKDAKASVRDPSDTTCLMASLEQDEDACVSTTDDEGNACEWCSLAGFDMCLNMEQADMAGQFGAECGGGDVEERVRDPSDTTCLMASLEQDEDACVSTTDLEGNACEWCSLAGFGMCLNAEQADMAGQFGATCDADNDEEELKDPSDTTCLMVSLDQDEDACTSSADQDGQGCEWCSLAGYGMCLTVDQADMAAQFGAVCGQPGLAVSVA